MEAALERVTLHESDSTCEAIERFAVFGPLVPGIDVEEVSYQTVDARHAAIVVGFSLELVPMAGDEALAFVSASFRLFYGMPGVLDPAAQRAFASSRAVTDSWPYWLEFLASALARMGLSPLRLPATPPERLTEIALEAFDVELQVAASRSAKTWGGEDLSTVRASLPRDEVMVFDTLWPVIARLNDAKIKANSARRAAHETGSQVAIATAHKAGEAVTHWQSRLDAIWRTANPRVLGRLVERLTTPVGSPIASVQVVEVRDAGAVSRLRAARDRAAYERAVASVAAVARGRIGSGRIEAVGPAGSPAFRAWVTTPDRLAVDVNGEVWNAVPLDDEIVLASKML